MAAEKIIHEVHSVSLASHGLVHSALVTSTPRLVSAVHSFGWPATAGSEVTGNPNIATPRHTGMFQESVRHCGLIGNGSGNIYNCARAAQTYFRVHTPNSAHQACSRSTKLDKEQGLNRYAAVCLTGLMPHCRVGWGMYSWIQFACYPAHKPLSSSFLGLPYKFRNINHKKELLRSLWVVAEFPRSEPGTHQPKRCRKRSP